MLFVNLENQFIAWPVTLKIQSPCNQGKLMKQIGIVFYILQVTTQLNSCFLTFLHCLILIKRSIFQVGHLQEFPFYEQSRLNTLLLVHPVAVTLPLLSMTFPICWIIANYFALAKLVMVIEIKSGL